MQAAESNLIRLISDWAPLALILSPIVVAAGVEIWTAVITPRLIASPEIDRLADEMLARYPDDPEQAALREEERHWYLSDSFEQAKWRRVRRSIGRRLREQMKRPAR